MTADSSSPNVTRPRVVHLVPALFGTAGIVGGGERYAFELARHMAEVVPTRLVSFADRSLAYREGGLAVRATGRPWYIDGQRTNPFSVRFIAHLLWADVIHCHQQHVIASSLAALVARMTRKRVFVTDLGGGGRDVSNYVSTDSWYHGHLHLSEYSRHVFRHTTLPRARVIFGGVDTDKFSPDPGVRRTGTALFVGRLLAHKGVMDLVDAAGPDTPVELVGRPYDAAFFRDLEARSQGKPVTFRHDVDDTGLVRAYRRALCLVLPSVYRDNYGRTTDVPELLGQTLLEARACGTPVICTRVASMPEVVADGETGFVVPPNDPKTIRDRLCWFRDHPAEADRMGQAGRRRVLDLFTWPVVVRRCLEAYAGAGAQ